MVAYTDGYCAALVCRHHRVGQHIVRRAAPIYLILERGHIYEDVSEPHLERLERGRCLHWRLPGATVADFVLLHGGDALRTVGAVDQRSSACSCPTGEVKLGKATGFGS